MNPFTTEYLEKEIEFYNPKPYRGENGVDLVIKPVTPCSRIDEYFNKQMWLSGPSIPILRIDGQIWMSLTWLEVQSAWCVIQDFKGDVLLGGLGMGYVALRLAAKPEVDSVTVYEIDERVIEFFRTSQLGRPELDKIKVIHGDVREAEGVFDYAFIDIYQTLLPEEALSDASLFYYGWNGLEIRSEVRIWGQELAWLTISEAGYSIYGDLAESERDLLGHWWEDEEKVSLMRLVDDIEYCMDLATALGREF